jgi:phosphoglycolate phosphatase-like HAD superfamily hydrolase
MDATTPSAVTLEGRLGLRPMELLRRLRDPAPPVTGVVFGLEGVLYDDSVWRRWLLKLVMRLGVHTTYTPFFRVWQRDYLERVKRGQLEYWQALREFLHAAGLSNGQIDEVVAAGYARHREFEWDVIPLPGVAHTLARLAQWGVHLSVVSNYCPESAAVGQRLERLGLGTFFEHALAAVDLERTDDDRSGFAALVNQTPFPNGSLAYVGRDARALADAAAAGLRTVAVNYDDDAQAAIYIGHFAQLLEVLPWQVARAQAA